MPFVETVRYPPREVRQGALLLTARALRFTASAQAEPSLRVFGPRDRRSG
jgi:hypothetical protein